MKPLLTITLILTSSLISFAQITNTPLDYNNSNGIISNSGTIFNNTQGGYPGYEIPKGGGNHAIFSAQFWFTAKDVNSNIFTTLGGAENLGTDIDHGPFSSSSMYADASYDKPFMITLCQEEIDQFNIWWECSNGQNPVGCENIVQPQASVLGSIYDWPGNGITALGQSHSLAPFYDRNSDGIYDPVGGGDYPLIKGCCATYMIQNDAGNLHTYSGTDPIGIEMHYLFYQFGANSDLYNTTFLDVMAINLGNTNYTEFAHGFMVDADLGYLNDDYFGSDSLTNTMIFYNSDNMDEGAYLTNPPALGVVALENNSTSIISYGSFPSTPTAAWNLMNGLQPNGVALQDQNGNSTKFLLSGDPNDGAAWNETSEGYQPGDRRGLTSTTQGAFNMGDTVLQTYAIVYSDGGNHLENASNVINLASWAKTFYDTEINDGCDAGGILGSEEISKEAVSIYPNPSTGEFTVSIADGQLQSLEIFNLAGKAVSFSQRSNGSATQIDLQEKASGVYLIKITSDQGSSTKRLIID